MSSSVFTAAFKFAFCTGGAKIAGDLALFPEFKALACEASGAANYKDLTDDTRGGEKKKM